MRPIEFLSAEEREQFNAYKRLTDKANATDEMRDAVNFYLYVEKALKREEWCPRT